MMYFNDLHEKVLPACDIFTAYQPNINQGAADWSALSG